MTTKAQQNDRYRAMLGGAPSVPFTELAPGERFIWAIALHTEHAEQFVRTRSGYRQAAGGRVFRTGARTACIRVAVDSL